MSKMPVSLYARIEQKIYVNGGKVCEKVNYGISGAGEFGEVYKGVLTTKDNKKVPIAAKTLKVFHKTIIMHVHLYYGPVLYSITK